MKFTHLYLVLLLCSSLLASCEKGDVPLVLPPKGTSTHGSVEMGADYSKQVYFDFETGKSVMNSDPKSWDFAFEASADGKHVFMNGGNEIFIHNTGKQELKEVTGLPQGLSTTSSVGWTYDDPSGLPSGSGMGEWWKSNGGSSNVFIVQNPSGLKKLRIVEANATGYVIEWMPLQGSTQLARVSITKDTAHNFVYYSFEKGVVHPEPSKDCWDIVFTRYRYVYVDYPTAGSNFPYEVNGALLNPFGTQAAADSVTAFADITLQKAQALTLVNRRDVIGFDWKLYNFSSGYYEVNRRKSFVVSTRKGQLYKMHFLDFYKGSAKGNPSFEYERLK